VANSLFTRNTDRRGSIPKITPGSISVLWFATRTTGPVDGTRDRPRTRTR
jgi:hypothetical protein